MSLAKRDPGGSNFETLLWQLIDARDGAKGAGMSETVESIEWAIVVLTREFVADRSSVRPRIAAVSA